MGAVSADVTCKSSAENWPSVTLIIANGSALHTMVPAAPRNLVFAGYGDMPTLSVPLVPHRSPLDPLPSRLSRLTGWLMLVFGLAMLITVLWIFKTAVGR